MLFRRQYTVRRYGEQTFTGGYASQSYTDTAAEIDIQPAGDTPRTADEGASTVMHLSAWSDFPFRPADRLTRTKGDRVLWHGRWYECTSCECWDGTPLAHYNAKFTVVTEDKQ